MEKKEISVGITAFIDMLGFSDKVTRAESIDDILKIEFDIETIQKEFDFEPADELTRNVQRLNKSTILAFSDCIIVNIPLQSESTKYSGSFDPILSELVGFAYAQAHCIQKSLFIRGGIDIGWWYRNGTKLISQSMVGAVKREQFADVPVIAITEKLYNYFFNHNDRSFYSKDIDPIPNVFRKLESESNPFYYIDYISICLNDLSWHRSSIQKNEFFRSSEEEKNRIVANGYRENVNDWMGLHSKRIKEAYNSVESDKVKKKYEWLANYHNEIATDYELSKIYFCNL